MAKKVIVDFRMRKVEKEYLRSLGYELIENGFNSLVYDEISSHVDIYFLKVGNRIIISPEKRGMLKVDTIVGQRYIGEKYPEDIPYNVAIVGKNAVHNFNYTDPEVKKYLKTCEYNLIDVSQGYSNCSTTIIDNNSCIVSDISIATALSENGVDVLYALEPDIKLLKRTNKLFAQESKMCFEYSDMSGFIGGAIARIENTVIVFGDIKKLVNADKIKKYINSKGLELKDFPGLDVIDYGGIVEVVENE